MSSDQQPDEAEPSSTGPSQEQQPTTTSRSNNPNTLPPEAITLATTLFNAARAGETATLQQYISAGIPPNLTNTDGSTLLMLAAYHGHAETVSALLALGADPNALNDRGQSPLAGAVFKGYGEVVKVLAINGRANVYAGQPNAIDTASMFRRVDLLALMGVVNGSGETLDIRPTEHASPEHDDP